ncbi:MAG: hypothetical protein LWY06_04555, partial [Firmicutes bacterium]|nr:hypothetical protein [Bacillota bacterium]
DRKKIAFLVNDQLPANNNIQQNLLPEMNRYSQKSQCTWLVTWDVESNEVEKIAVMPQQDKIGIIPSTLLWSPATDCSLISLYTIEGVFIIDASRHIVKKILFKGDSDWPVSVIRWSPDGRQLGILKDNGTFYIYNIAEDILTKVNSDPECFNFVWVE